MLFSTETCAFRSSFGVGDEISLTRYPKSQPHCIRKCDNPQPPFEPRGVFPSLFQLIGGSWVGDVICLDFPPHPRRGNHETEHFKPSQPLDHRRTGKPRAFHDLIQTQRHALVRKAAAGFEHDQIDFDRLAANPRELSTVEEHALDPVGLDGHGDWHINPSSLLRNPPFRGHWHPRRLFAEFSLPAYLAFRLLMLFHASTSVYSTLPANSVRVMNEENPTEEVHTVTVSRRNTEVSGPRALIQNDSAVI